MFFKVTTPDGLALFDAETVKSVVARNDGSIIHFHDNGNCIVKELVEEVQDLMHEALYSETTTTDESEYESNPWIAFWIVAAVCTACCYIASLFFVK